MQAAPHDPSRPPRVSCLMVTRGHVELLSFALACYLGQDYPHRELVIVTDGVSAQLTALVARHAERNVRLVEAPPGLTLGDLRNYAAARATGDILCQWDDDDLYDPARLSTGVHVLQQSKFAAAFLSQWIMWWPARRMFALSRTRLWEGTMCIWRQHHGLYPALRRGEDSVFVRQLTERTEVAQVKAPYLYCYVITGRNSWDTAHFDLLFAEAEQNFVGPAYDAMMQRLAGRMPIRQYDVLLQKLAAEVNRPAG
ncbi:MAG: glycosyltransferase family A protein [Hyphomicrobiales bacterium]|uniref:glycosyltransferase family 2 protein n=1 Tax=Aestuariivirga sp. TaxID=2650926 RepID=UPI0035B4277C